MCMAARSHPGRRSRSAARPGRPSSLRKWRSRRAPTPSPGGASSGRPSPGSTREKRGFGIHGPAKWTRPNGFYRIVTDDDGNRPVAILYRGSHELRLVEGSDTGADAAMILATKTADRVGLAGAKEADGLRWGLANLPPVPLRISDEEIFPDWGDDGRLGWALIERFHVFLDMPNRWTYIQPIKGR